ncbi:hypothetical protein NL676_013636 [Syzygium grande]|nr:hypothetical protein NL676_013636 [Syzygium grande]
MSKWKKRATSLIFPSTQAPPKSAPPQMWGGTSNEWPSNSSFDIWRRGAENDDDYHYALKSRSDNSVLKADVATDT